MTHVHEWFEDTNDGEWCYDCGLTRERPTAEERAELKRNELRRAHDCPGLDVERLAEAVAFARGRSYVDMLDTLTARKIKAVYDAGTAEPGVVR